jgi:ribosome biogenesis GTPase
MTLSELAEFGWDSFFQQQITDEQSVPVVPVRVMNVHKSGLQVAGVNVDTQAEQLADDDGRATVGDWLLFNTETQRIVRRLDRKSIFKRRAPGTDRREQLIAANVDTLFIVSSCNQDFNEARLERYLSIARDAEVMALIVLTKADLADEPQVFVQKAAKLAPGIHVEAVNALDEEDLRCLDAWLGHGQTVALLGSSGVGKSTLSNTLLGGSDITTQAIRDDDAKGRHTTTSRTMHHLPGGAWLLDTPGMRELQLTDVRTGLDDVFAEITELAATCRFVDCTHEAEPGCAIQRAIDDGEIDVERLNRWRKLIKEEAYNKESIADRRARGRALGKYYKSAINDKKSRKGS